LPSGAQKRQSLKEALPLFSTPGSTTYRQFGSGQWGMVSVAFGLKLCRYLYFAVRKGTYIVHAAIDVIAKNGNGQ
jgi:hypothetical protein